MDVGSGDTGSIFIVSRRMRQVPTIIIYSSFSRLKCLFSIKSDSTCLYTCSCPARESANNHYDNRSEDHCLHYNHTFLDAFFVLLFFHHKLSFRFLIETWVDNVFGAGGIFGSLSVVRVIFTKRIAGMLTGEGSGEVVP